MSFRSSLCFADQLQDRFLAATTQCWRARVGYDRGYLLRAAGIPAAYVWTAVRRYTLLLDRICSSFEGLATYGFEAAEGAYLEQDWWPIKIS